MKDNNSSPKKVKTSYIENIGLVVLGFLMVILGSVLKTVA